MLRINFITRYQHEALKIGEVILILVTSFYDALLRLDIISLELDIISLELVSYFIPPLNF